jgi:hypothetical protein
MRDDVDKHIKKRLAKNHACYVLITCDEPSEDGEMKVEMSYQGDADIAAFLLQGAQSYIDEQEKQEIQFSCEIHQLPENQEQNA